MKAVSKRLEDFNILFQILLKNCLQKLEKDVIPLDCQKLVVKIILKWELRQLASAFYQNRISFVPFDFKLQQQSQWYHCFGRETSKQTSKPLEYSLIPKGNQRNNNNSVHVIHFFLYIPFKYQIVCWRADSRPTIGSNRIICKLFFVFLQICYRISKYQLFLSYFWRWLPDLKENKIHFGDSPSHQYFWFGSQVELRCVLLKITFYTV